MSTCKYAAGVDALVGVEVAAGLDPVPLEVLGSGDMALLALVALVPA